MCKKRVAVVIMMGYVQIDGKRDTDGYNRGRADRCASVDAGVCIDKE